jgi:hypothetical protein
MKIRKTIVCGIMAALLMGTTITAQGMEMPDLSTCTDDEVIALLDNVQNEIADRKIERTATLEKGKYIGGKDIPAGDYVLRKEPNDGDSGIIWLQAKDDPEDEYPSKLYKFLDDNEEGVFYISVEEGDVLSTPYRITLTISAGLMFE